MKTTHAIHPAHIGLLALAVTAAGLVGVASASADSGFGYKARGVEPTCDSDRRAEVEQAIGDGDYDAWSALMDGRGRVSDVVTEENFDTFIAMHEAMDHGDLQAAQEYREELGLGVRPQDGSGYRGKMGGRGGMHRGVNNGTGSNGR